MEVVMNVLPRRNWTRRCRDLLRGGVCVRARAPTRLPRTTKALPTLTLPLNGFLP